MKMTLDVRKTTGIPENVKQSWSSKTGVSEEHDKDLI